MPEKIDRVRPTRSRPRRRAARRFAVLLGVAAMLAPAASAQAAPTGGASATPEADATVVTEAPTIPTAPATELEGETGSSLVAAARTRIGSVYSWGSTGPRAFDCSGLVTWAARRAHISVPRVSFAQFKTGTPVKASEIQPGDLVFFDTAGPGASDVGIATNARTEISATSSQGVVEHQIFDSYWGPHFVGARRVEG